MKKICMAILAIILLITPTYCAAMETPHADFLVEKSLVMATLIGELAHTDEYLAQYTSMLEGAPEILEEIQVTDFSAPEKAALIHIPLPSLMNLASANFNMEKMSERVQQLLQQRFAGMLLHTVNGGRGMDKLAVSSALGVNDAFPNPGITKTRHVILSYTSGLHTITAFVPNAENTVMVSSGIAFGLPEFLGVFQEDIHAEEALSALWEMGFTYEEVDGETIKNGNYAILEPTDITGRWYEGDKSSLYYAFLADGQYLRTSERHDYALEEGMLTLRMNDDMDMLFAQSEGNNRFANEEGTYVLYPGRGGIPLSSADSADILLGDWDMNYSNKDDFFRFLPGNVMEIFSDGVLESTAYYSIYDQMVLLMDDDRSMPIPAILTEDNTLKTEINQALKKRIPEDRLSGNWQIEGVDNRFYTFYEDGSYSHTTVIGKYTCSDGVLTLINDEGEVALQLREDGTLRSVEGEIILTREAEEDSALHDTDRDIILTRGENS